MASFSGTTPMMTSGLHMYMHTHASEYTETPIYIQYSVRKESIAFKRFWNETYIEAQFSILYCLPITQTSSNQLMYTGIFSHMYSTFVYLSVYKSIEVYGYHLGLQALFLFL